MQEIYYPEQQDGRADSATITKIARVVSGRTIGAWKSDRNTRDTCDAAQYVAVKENNGGVKNFFRNRDSNTDVWIHFVCTSVTVNVDQ